MATHPLSVLVLDDDPTRHAAFVANNPNCRVHSVYTCKDAVAAIYDHPFDVICFDHDLGWNTDQNTYETSIPFAKLVRQLIDEGGILDSVIMLVHSSNPVGAQDILSYFSRTVNHSFKVPWAWRMPNLFHTICSDGT